MGRPHVVDAIKNSEIQLIINTGTGDAPRQDGYAIRRAALKFDIPYVTTIPGAMAMSKGLSALRHETLSVKPLQEYHE
jgi:carbamoyl-phosphate synthase large subunit